MATRMTSPLAGIGWLRNAVNVGGRKPGTLLAAAGLTTLVCLVPMLVSMPVQVLFAGKMAVIVGAMVMSMLVGLALSPVFAGFLQVIDAIEGGRPVRARDIFAPYRNGVAKPIILLALLLMLVYFAGMALMAFAAGPELRSLYVEMLTRGVAQPPAPEIFGAFMRAYAVGLAVMFLIGGMWAIGYGQVAIGRRPVVEALVDGLTGTLKNLVPMIVLLLAMILVGIVLAIALMIVVGVLVLIGKLVGDWFVLVTFVPLYVGFVLAMFVVTFGLSYFFWRDVCAADAGAQVAEV